MSGLGCQYNTLPGNRARKRENVPACRLPAKSLTQLSGQVQSCRPETILRTCLHRLGKRVKQPWRNKKNNMLYLDPPLLAKKVPDLSPAKFSAGFRKKPRP